MTLLITGGAGFVGSHYARLARRRRPEELVVNVDALTYAGHLENLRDLHGDAGHVFARADIRDAQTILGLIRRYRVDVVVNFAAESHVDRSISRAEPFLETNALGTLRVLEAARAGGVRRFVQVSTDEVYGSLGPTGAFEETTPAAPRSPYAASKAAADHFVLAFHHTYGIDAVITRCSNNYGPFQLPEKLIPLMILNALEGLPLPLYGDGRQVRDWIHVEDHCEAVDVILSRGLNGHIYNIGADDERANLDVVREILRLTDRDPALIRHVPDRPGHDRRYAMNAQKLREGLGWRPRRKFPEGLAETVAWYRANRAWSKRVRGNAWRDHYQYGSGLAAGATR
jgi:dTDP-glucose 4,6-dehydratase